MFIHVSMHVCVWMCVCLCACTYVFVCMCIFVHACVCVYCIACACVNDVYACEYACVCIYVCACTCVFVCMHACRHVCACVCVCERVRERERERERVFMQSTSSLTCNDSIHPRGVRENTQGWTLMLQEDMERYELMGYDYALDLISEMELAPNFPHGKAYFLVSFDRTQERIYHKRRHEGPHNAEQERIMVLVRPLPEMLKRTTPVVSSGHPRSQGFAVSPTPSASAGKDELGFSTTSVLNQRPTEILATELSESRMNQRYIKRRAPAPPNGHIPNGHMMNGSVVNGDMSTIAEDDDDLDLSQSRINGRYFPNGLANGHVGELSSSNLNKRYSKRPAAGYAAGRTSAVQDQIRKKQGVGVTTADVHSITSEHSDWSHWVEDVFNSALNEHDDVASEGKSLHSRIKGGGKGVPGVQTQQVG